MVFGVFDRLHDGHRYFLKQAKALGDKLVIIVTDDEMVFSLKKKMPTHSLAERIKNIENEKIGDEIFPSDKKPNQWIIIREIKPDIIALGHDQDALEAVLKEKKADFTFNFELVKIPGHETHIYHTSLLS